MRLTDYRDLHAWSVEHPDLFWSLVWDFCEVIGDKGERLVADHGKMPGARYLPDSTLNFAENLLRRSDGGEAIVFRGEDKVVTRLTFAELNALVSRMQQALRAAGVGVGDRVAAMLPNGPDAVGAGARGDLDRRDLVVLLAGFRRARRARPLRPDRAQGVRDGRRLLVQRQADPARSTSSSRSSSTSRRPRRS